MLLALEVIWIPDQTIKPPGPKMVVSVAPVQGYFFRINSEPKWQQPVLLLAKDHDFLKRDSYLECGAPLDLDDYVVQQSLRERGIIGTIAQKAVKDIIAAVEKAWSVSDEDRAIICAALRDI